MTTNRYSIMTAACLAAVSLSAQGPEAQRPTAPRPQRVTLLKQSQGDAASRRAEMVILVEKLAAGDLTAEERAECKRMLLERIGGAGSKAKAPEAIEVRVEALEEEVLEEGEGKDEGRAGRVRWRVERGEEASAPGAVRFVRPSAVRRWVGTVSEDAPESRVRYRMIERGEDKPRDLARRVRREVIKMRDDARAAQGRDVVYLRKGADAGDLPRSLRLDVERLESRIVEALEGSEGNVEVEIDVRVLEQEGEERGRRGAWVFEHSSGDERPVFEWREERGHHEREHEEHGHHEREHEEHGHHEREHEEHGHHEREHEEHEHDEHEHDEHEHDEHEHDEHEHMLEEAAEVVEELFETIEGMRDEIRELREMVEELHHALEQRREAAEAGEGWRRGARGRFRRQR